jgi:hypothetical protein
MYSYKVQYKSENLNHCNDAHDTFSTSDFSSCVILSILLHLHASPCCNILCNLLCFLMFLLFLFLCLILDSRSVLCSNEFKNTRSTFEIWADEITGLKRFRYIFAISKGLQCKPQPPIILQKTAGLTSHSNYSEPK